VYRLLLENSNATADSSLTENGIVNFSLIKDLNAQISFNGFSIKYVFSGVENYKVNGNKFKVNKGEYLLGNRFSEGKVDIGSKEFVKGVCIDIKPSILSEVVGSFLEPGTSVSDLNLDKFFTSGDFFENKYPHDKTNLGQMLCELGKIINNNPYANYEFNKEFFYTLSEKIVLDHQPILSQLNSIKSLKSITKKDLYRKVLKGREFLDNNYLSKIEIAAVAKEANISEYHFYRLFKSIFNISPLQYIIARRLEIAKQLLKNKALNLTDIAVITGFSDMHSLSKAFKKHYGVSPSKILL